MKIKEQDEQRMVVGGSFGNKVIIDKLTQNITVDSGFLFFRRQRVIPFSDVRNIVIDYEQKVSEKRAHDAWKVSINNVGKKLKIDHTRNKASMFHLASEISSFIGTELVDNSAIVRLFDKAERLFVKVFRKGEQARRKEAIESSRRRIQELRDGRNKGGEP